MSNNNDSGNKSNNSAENNVKEDELRKALRRRLHTLSRREPLEPTYKALFASTTTPSALRDNLIRDPLYKDVRSLLRARVEAFAASGGLDAARGRGREREDGAGDDDAMRAAFTLREAMPHEQEVLVRATLQAERAALGGRGEKETRVRADAARALQDAERRRRERRARVARERERRRREAEQRARRERAAAAAAAPPPAETPSRADERARDERERTRLIERQKERERQRVHDRRREEEESRRSREEDARRRQKAETPMEATYRLYEPIFRALWDMEFANLGGTNPFRIVINRENCVAMGAPDYFDLVERPMNLTYIQDKVQKKSYNSLQEFLEDVKLMITNALHYNSDPNNEYHLAAKKMKKVFRKMAHTALESIEPNKKPPGKDSKADK